MVVKQFKRLYSNSKKNHSLGNALCKKKIFFVTFSILIVLCSCISEIDRETLIYDNNFETVDLTNIEGGNVTSYLGQNILGTYNNGGFKLILDGLGRHDYVQIQALLYVHDSWDGNAKSPDGTDYWGVMVDSSEVDVFKTSFSNSACSSNYCYMQSYPERYPFLTFPGTGASAVNLPAFCKSDGSTSAYEIDLIFPHRKSKIEIVFWDELNQPNTNDAQCDESWSLNNIQVKLLSF